MGNKGPVRYRKYTEEFKVEAIGRFGWQPSKLDQPRAGKLESAEFAKPVKRSLAEAEAENSRLRRELESTRLDLEIVKKAAAYFAKESR